MVLVFGLWQPRLQDRLSLDAARPPRPPYVCHSPTDRKPPASVPHKISCRLPQLLPRLGSPLIGERLPFHRRAPCRNRPLLPCRLLRQHSDITHHRYHHPPRQPLVARKKSSPSLARDLFASLLYCLVPRRPGSGQYRPTAFVLRRLARRQLLTLVS